MAGMIIMMLNDGKIPEPLPENVHERDIAAVAVRALCEDGHAGSEYVLTGPASLSQRERDDERGEFHRSRRKAIAEQPLPPAEGRGAHVGEAIMPPIAEHALPDAARHHAGDGAPCVRAFHARRRSLLSLHRDEIVGVFLPHRREPPQPGDQRDPAGDEDRGMEGGETR